MKTVISIAMTKKIFIVFLLCLFSISGFSQTRNRVGGQQKTTTTQQSTQQKAPQQTITTTGGQKVSISQQPQSLEPVEISGSLKTLIKSDYMSFCNIPFNLELTEFEKKLEDADFEYEDEQSEDLFLNGYSNIDVFSGFFPSMAVTVYVHYTKDHKVYRVELQTKANTDENSNILFNKWHKRLKVYVDGGENDNVEDPMAFSQSGPGIYNITFFPEENSSADVKGWILMRIVYEDKTASNYDKDHSSFVTVNYIDAQNTPAEVKTAWGL